MDSKEPNTTDFSQANPLLQYLPYGLLGRGTRDGRDYTAESWSKESGIIWKPLYKSHPRPLKQLPNRTDCKPLLRSLKQLYTHKRQNGKTLPEMWKEADSHADFFMQFDSITLKSISVTEHRIVNSLIIHRYDIAGLIEKGEAFDIAEIEANEQTLTESVDNPERDVAIEFHKWMQENDTMQNAGTYCNFSDQNMFEEFMKTRQQ